MNTIRFLFPLMLSLTLLVGCSDKEVEIKGQQIAVLAGEESLSADPSHKITVKIPEPQHNQQWTHVAFHENHHIPHASLGNPIAKCFSHSIGSGSSHDHRLLTPPVVGPTYVYTMDARGTVRAFDKNTGQKYFATNTRPQKESIPIGHGGLAYAQNHLYVATGYAQLIALDASNGNCLWRQDLSAPVRSAPTVAHGRIFVTTVDNVISAHDATNGSILWTYTGLSENAGLLGSASPAAHADMIVVPFSSGEVIALHAETGRPLWGEALTTSRKADAVANIATIKAQPVIDGERVFVVGHAGRMLSFDIKSGEPVWEQKIGGTETPLAVGNAVFVVSERGELYALHKTDGKIIWKSTLPPSKDKKKPLHWQGPVLAGGHLLLTNSGGQLLFVSPADGQIVQCMPIGEPFELGPVVANNTLYLLSDRGNLIAYR